MHKPDRIIARMRGWAGNLYYRQVLGAYSAAIDGTLRPDPDQTGYADCTSSIQHAYLKECAPNPGYYTGDMRTKGQLVTTSRNPNFGAMRKGDIALMQWRSGTWHAELVTGDGTLIGHPGPGKGPAEKNLRGYLAGATYWEIRRHDLTDKTPTTTNTTTTTAPDAGSEEDEMKGLTYTKDAGKTRIYMLFNEVSGFYSEFSNGAGKGSMGGAYVNPLAQNWKTGSWPSVTEGHAAALKRDLDKIRQGK